MTTTTLATYKDLADKTIFISGGATGIGSDMVAAFALQGARVHFVDIDEEAGIRLADDLAETAGRRPVFTVCDVTEDESLFAAIDAAEADCGLAVLINNAANDKRHNVEEVDAGFWDWNQKINLRHQFFAAQRAFSHMKGRGTGSIINFGSVAPRLAVADLAVYSTCKSAVKGMTRSLAREFGHHGVRVNAIVPGAILTPRQLELWISPEREKEILTDQCLHRRLVGDDIAQMALFLASDVSSACTSQEFVVDGGITG